MYILDTDHLSFIQRKGQEGKNILARLSRLSEDVEVAVTVITYEEQIRGRLNFISKSRTTDETVKGYQGLQQTLVDYQSIVVIHFNNIAIVEHQRLRKTYPRLGNMDLKIAAIALVNNAILLTRNKSDFGQIMELKIEDWSN
jgi:tRNA(fMet)-specific endonuclease VapC